MLHLWEFLSTGRRTSVCHSLSVCVRIMHLYLFTHLVIANLQLAKWTWVDGNQPCSSGKFTRRSPLPPFTILNNEKEEVNRSSNFWEMRTIFSQSHCSSEMQLFFVFFRTKLRDSLLKSNHYSKVLQSSLDSLLTAHHFVGKSQISRSCLEMAL